MTLNDEQVAMLRAALDSADELCTAVVNGQPALMQRALAVAACLNTLKRKKVLSR